MSYPGTRNNFLDKPSGKEGACLFEGIGSSPKILRRPVHSRNRSEDMMDEDGVLLFPMDTAPSYTTSKIAPPSGASHSSFSRNTPIKGDHSVVFSMRPTTLLQTTSTPVMTKYRFDSSGDSSPCSTGSEARSPVVVPDLSGFSQSSKLKKKASSASSTPRRMPSTPCRVPLSQRSDKTLFRFGSAPRSFQLPNSPMSPCSFSQTDGELRTTDFEIIDTVGEGSFSTVHMARNLRTNNISALKVSKKPLRGESEVKRLQNTLKLIETLSNNSHILKYRACWRERGFMHEETEYCSGGNLANHVVNLRERGELTEQHVWKWIAEIASGLRALHDNASVHMDVKAENIYVDGNGSLKIGDFGLLTRISDYSGAEGDARYLAPEVLAICDLNVSSKVDIFSLGATLWEICTGLEMPLNGKIWNQFRNNQVEFPDDVTLSDSLRQLIVDMMDKDPEKRPTASMILDKDECRRHLPPTTTMRRAARPVRSNRLRSRSASSRRTLPGLT